MGIDVDLATISRYQFRYQGIKAHKHIPDGS